MVQDLSFLMHSAILFEFSGGGRVEENSRWFHQNLPGTLNSFLRLGSNVPKVMWGQRARRPKRIKGS